MYKYTLLLRKLGDLVLRVARLRAVWADSHPSLSVSGCDALPICGEIYTIRAGASTNAREWRRMRPMLTWETDGTTHGETDLRI